MLGSVATQGGMWCHLVYNLMKYWFSFSMWLNLLFTWTPYLLTISNIELKEFINRKETLNHNIIRRHLFHAQFHESHLTVYIPTTIHFNSVTKVQNKKGKFKNSAQGYNAPRRKFSNFKKSKKMVVIRTGPYIKKEVEFCNFSKSLDSSETVKKISDPFQFSESIRTQRLTVVYFNLPYYNPCRYFNPKFLKMVDDFKTDVNFIQVD